MKIGLYFGSFNPIHVGHLIIASFVADNTDVEQVWIIVSPQNPLKKSSTLLNEYDRLHLVQLAVEGDPRLKPSDIEFKLPRPSFTIDTLTYLTEKYPAHQFAIIMGSDSFSNLPKWKNWEMILKNYPIYVYLRPGFAEKMPHGTSVVFLQAPLLNISATTLRETIKRGRSIKYLVPERVEHEIERNNYYRLKL
jgi:nicotinate-nucleotide adenylyltransferase